jgi:hypothetical protein
MRGKNKLATQLRKRANLRIATQTRQLQKLHGINAVIDVTDNESQPVCVRTLTPNPNPDLVVVLVSCCLVVVLFSVRLIFLLDGSMIR